MGNIILKELSTIDVLQCQKLAAELEEKLKKEDFNEELLKALCEDGALCFMAAFRDDKRAFSSPLDALMKLSLSELCELRVEYAECFLGKRGEPIEHF